MPAKALRNIPKLAGEAYAAGDAIPDEVIAKISPQVLRSLVNNSAIEVDGMERGIDAGASAHLKARVDNHHDRLAKAEAENVALRASHDELAARITALEASSGTKAVKRTARKT